MGFDVVGSASRGAGDVNEDALGSAEWGRGGYHSCQAAWVLDGATGLAEREQVPGAASDAAWLADALGREMAAIDFSLLPADRYFSTVIEAVEARYRALVPDYPSLPPHALPSAAVVWLKAGPDWLELWHQGDCVGVVEQEGEKITVVGTVDRTGSDGTLREMLATRRSAEVAGGELLAAMMSELRRRRDRLNQPDGYWMMGIDRRAAKHMDCKVIRNRPGTRILMCSDGYWRLVDHFHKYDPAGLIAATFARGPAALIDELRVLEAADPDCLEVPRVKPSDDATAMILQF